MRRKNEDELIKLAFGDAEGDSARAKRLMEEDTEAAALFADYDEIRQGLKQLAGPVPEHQLSSERLREAILRDGLKQEKNAGFGWRWALAPAAVMACAFLITLRLGNDPDVLPDGFKGVASLVPPVETPVSDDPAIDFEPSVRVPNPDAAATEIEAAPRTESSSSGLVASASKPAVKERSTIPMATRTEALSPAEISNLAIGGGLPAGAVAMIDGAPEETAIVIINSDIDDATGAKRATEVTTASNVIIGG